MTDAGSTYQVIGLMSGTSLDGLDIALCSFGLTEKNNWDYRILNAETLPYNDEWRTKLKNAFLMNAEELCSLSFSFGQYCGLAVKDFLQRHRLKADLVASHGHTVFHRPDQGYTLQIGQGSSIAVNCGITTIYDFRSQDVALGGQGAPLVPVGDHLLFGQYDACLNLGGFANISMTDKQKRIAWDICPANIVLNKLAEERALNYDPDGRLASAGCLIPEMLEKLEALKYYSGPAPKSLGREWLEQEVVPILNEYSGERTEDRLATVCRHIANRICHDASRHGRKGTMLISGGGANNEFLIRLIREAYSGQLKIAEPLVRDFREALIFAFLGLLRMRGEVNCLASVTGAVRDHSSGTMCFANKSNHDQNEQ